MNQNKTTKYLKYAIGEIILVVIGILIALSINNWNEIQNKNKFERKVLTEILSDTEADLIEMTNALRELNESQLSSTIILDVFNKNLVYNDSMDVHFAQALRIWSLSPNTTAFEAAKTEGLRLIKNDSLRIKVSKINGFYYDYVKVLESRWQDYKTNIVLPYCLPLFEYYNFHNMKPTNYEDLKKDTIYQGLLKSLGAMRIRYIDWLNERLAVLVTLNKQLKEELNA